MGKRRTKEEKRRDNVPFLRAFDWLAKEKKMTDVTLSMMIGVDNSSISRYRSGEKGISPATKECLARAFNGRLNMRYLDGESQYMLLSNVPDEEINEYSLRDSNPDFDVMQAAKEKSTDSTCSNVSSSALPLQSQSYSVADPIHPTTVSEASPSVPVSQQEQFDNMLHLYAQMIRGIDDFRQQLRSELSVVQSLRADLHDELAAVHTLRKQLADTLAVLHPTPRQYDAPPATYGIAAETSNDKK